MSDYIKREDAKQLFLNHLGNHFPQSFKEQIVEKAFEEVPPIIDVIEVVRCKDCKWWDGNDCKARDIDVVDVDDFCSYGERRSE